MLPKKKRLSRKAFSRFFSTGTKYHSPLCTYVVAPSQDFYGAVVVSKKVARHAVDRNTLRRRFYAILRQYQVDTNLSGAYICILKPKAREVTFETMRSDLGNIIQKLKK